MAVVLFSMLFEKKCRDLTRSFGREKNLRALYDNETPTSGRATSSAWPTLGATTLKGGSKIQNLSKKCGKIFFISLKWILMVTSPWLPAKRKLYKTAKVERLTVSNKKWRWSQDLAILETPLQWRLTLWMLELRMLELWMLVFHFIEMNFNGNITLVACQVKVIQKNGTADCE